MEETNRDEKNRENLMARERLRYQWMLDSVAKFRLFFAGLVFAMLAFSVQFSIGTANRAVMWPQVAAWFLLLATGLLAVRDAGGFVKKHTEDKFDGLSPAIRRSMWGGFIVALGLLMSARLLSTWESARTPVRADSQEWGVVVATFGEGANLWGLFDSKEGCLNAKTLYIEEYGKIAGDYLAQKGKRGLFLKIPGSGGHVAVTFSCLPLSEIRGLPLTSQGWSGRE